MSESTFKTDLFVPAFERSAPLPDYKKWYAKQPKLILPHKPAKVEPNRGVDRAVDRGEFKRSSKSAEEFFSAGKFDRLFCYNSYSVVPCVWILTVSDV